MKSGGNIISTQKVDTKVLGLTHNPDEARILNAWDEFYVYGLECEQSLKKHWVTIRFVGLYTNEDGDFDLALKGGL